MLLTFGCNLAIIIFVSIQFHTPFGLSSIFSSFAQFNLGTPTEFRTQEAGIQVGDSLMPNSPESSGIQAKVSHVDSQLQEAALDRLSSSDEWVPDEC